jgi:hypothetical protein
MGEKLRYTAPVTLQLAYRVMARLLFRVNDFRLNSIFIAALNLNTVSPEVSSMYVVYLNNKLLDLGRQEK